MHQSALAEAMRQRGFSSWQQQTVNRVEAGVRTVQFEEGIALAEIFDVPVTSLSARAAS